MLCGPLVKTRYEFGDSITRDESTVRQKGGRQMERVDLLEL